MTQQLEECGIGIENLARGVAATDAVGCVRNQGPKVQLGSPQILLRGSESCVEPADQHGDEEEQREADNRGLQLGRAVLPGEREVGAPGEGEGGSDDSGLPAPVPGAYHDSDTEQSETAFG